MEVEQNVTLLFIVIFILLDVVISPRYNEEMIHVNILLFVIYPPYFILIAISSTLKFVFETNCPIFKGTVLLQIVNGNPKEL